jgi:hypothetical protein
MVHGGPSFSTDDHHFKDAIMSKKTLMGIAGGALVATPLVVFAAGPQTENRPPERSTALVAENHMPAVAAQAGRGGKYAGTGWSVKPNPQQAVIDATRQAMERLGQDKASYVLVAYTGEYDGEAIRKTLRRQLGDSVKIHGVASDAGVITEDGIHGIAGGAVGILVVNAGDFMQFGVGAADLRNDVSWEKASSEAIRRAIADAHVSDHRKPDVILMTGPSLSRRESEILKGIADVVGSEVPVLGGNAGFGLGRTNGTVLTGNEVLTQGVVFTAIYSRLKIGYAYENGFRMTDREGIVTRAEGKTIYEIDGKPALDVYNRWTDGELYDLAQAKGIAKAWQLTSLKPIAKEVSGGNRLSHWVVSAIPPDEEAWAKKSLTLAERIERGSRVRLLSASWQTMLHRGESTPAVAMVQGAISNQKAAFGLFFFCRIACDVIPKSELPKLPLLTRRTVGRIPLLGVITTGEQGPLSGLGNVNSHLAESMVIVGQE